MIFIYSVFSVEEELRYRRTTMISRDIDTDHPTRGEGQSLELYSLETQVSLQPLLHFLRSFFAMEMLTMLGCIILYVVLKNIPHLVLHDLNHCIYVDVSIAQDHVVENCACAHHI
jgi:hypothetical protein